MGVLTSKRNAERAAELFEFTQGIDVDSQLAPQEVRVQKAWAKGLSALGVLTTDELARGLQALDAALALMEAGQFEWRAQDEDVHMNLERFVTDKEGALGKKMHLGRSRNDLIATSLRLFVRDSLITVAAGLKDLTLALTEQAEKNLEVIIPGMTHLQHGQPVRFGHALAGHAWAFSRDIERVEMAGKRAVAVMPLGSAALAGTTLSIDLSKIAQELGFERAPLNSYDSVGDRDFVIEGLDALAGCAIHLSRLSEDFIIWSSTAIGLVKLPAAWSTGSSIMPNKRNPDVPELVRARSAHMMGAASEAHTLCKAVPTSYGSDLHEIKGVFMRSLAEMKACLSVLPQFTRGFEVSSKEAQRLLGRGHVLATEVADELAMNRGVPFREAYSQVAGLVELAESKDVQIEQLSASDVQAVAPKLTSEFLAKLTHQAAVEKRSNSGGSSLAQAREGIRVLRAKLAN